MNMGNLNNASKESFSAEQVARISGLSSYMIDYLSRSKIVKPTVLPQPGRGRRRLYSFGDIVVLRAVSTLLSSGISVARLRKGISTLQKQYGRELRTTPSHFFCTDGKNVYFRDASGVVSDLTKGGQQVFAFVIDLKRLQADTEKKLKAQRRAA
jgi:DNA-binding transcriptional MerR regulator